MRGAVILDANLTILLVVGSASRALISKHKRLRDYTTDDFDLLGLLVAQFSDILLLPDILTEASNLARQIEGPARDQVQYALRKLIMTAPELSVRSIDGAKREEFRTLGLTDAAILHVCALTIDGIRPTLVTSDADLANRALAKGYSVIDYKMDFQND